MKAEKITEEEVERLLNEHGFHTLAKIIAEDLEKMKKGIGKDLRSERK